MNKYISFDLPNNSFFNCFTNEEKKDIHKPEERVEPSPESSPINDKKKNPTFFERVEECATVVFTFLHREWSTVSETRRQIGRIHKIVKDQAPQVAAKFNRVIAAIGLLAIIDFARTVWQYPDKWEEFINNVNLEDIEGATLSGLSTFLTIPCSAMSSFSQFITSLSELGLFPTVAFLGIIVQPLALISLTYASFRGVYDLVWLIYHWIKSPSTVVEENGLEDLRSYLKEKLEVAEEEIKALNEKYPEMKADEIEKKVIVLKAKKINQLTRQTDAKIVKIMSRLQTHLNEHSTDMDTANKALDDIHTLMRRKVVAGSINTLSTIALETAMVTSMVFQVSPIVVPVIGLVKGGITIGKHYYERYGMGKGLNYSDWLVEKAYKEKLA